MSLEAAPAALRFDPPGPGSWKLDPVHHPRPVTRYWAEMHTEAFKLGFRDFTRYYGLLVDTMEPRYVNGFAYGRMLPISEEEIPARIARAEEVIDGRLWRDQVREWDRTAKPASIAAHRELQAVDPDALSDGELIDHLRRCQVHHAAMIAQHMRFTGAALLPVGDLLAHAGAWTGLPQVELLGMLRGMSPVSAGASAELEQLMSALSEEVAAQELLQSGGEPEEVLRTLRGLDTNVGRALSAYLDLVGYRLLDGFDISNRYALEKPEALLRAILAAAAGRDDDGSDMKALTAKVRDRVPEEHRREFDELLDEARLTYRIRDERGVFSDIWAAGLMRRAALAAGHRLAARGRIHEPEHFVDAGLEEMCSMLLGSGEPSAEDLAGRARYRASIEVKDVPAFIGDPPAPPPDLTGLPPAAARVGVAFGIAIEAVFGSSEAPHGDDLLRGLAASGGAYEGPARRVRGAAEFDRIQQGDVLVTESTTEAFNILLPLLGAIVTDAGGLLSHSAIVAREYGIPAVVGTRDATGRIPDGARVRVDGDAGEVAVIG